MRLFNPFLPLQPPLQLGAMRRSRASGLKRQISAMGLVKEGARIFRQDQGFMVEFAGWEVESLTKVFLSESGLVGFCNTGSHLRKAW